MLLLDTNSFALTRKTKKINKKGEYYGHSKKYYLIQEDFDKIKHTMKSLNAETVGIGSSDKNIDFDITLGSDNDLITVTINNGDVFLY